jgi:hypothetical protein
MTKLTLLFKVIVGVAVAGLLVLAVSGGQNSPSCAPCVCAVVNDKPGSIVLSTPSHQSQQHPPLGNVWLDMPEFPVFRPCVRNLFAPLIPPRSTMTAFGGHVEAVMILHYGTHTGKFAERRKIALDRLDPLLPKGWYGYVVCIDVVC